MGALNGKVAIVTGGTRGIGRAIVEKFVQEGASVGFSYVSSSEKANAIVQGFDDGKVKAFKSDASIMDEAKSLVDGVVAEFGKVDILVNNAGITRDNLMLRMSEDQWDEVIQTNLKSVFNLTKCILRTMLKQRAGSIINMGSVVGVFGNAGQANYAASKAGIIGFSKSIAKEVGSRGIRCNVITPGFIQTEMTDELPEDVRMKYIESIPLHRFGEVTEIAEGCVFLGGDSSRYITGQVISICGGMNM